MTVLQPGPLRRIAVVGAHCDDIAIGCGGTLAAICAANPGIAVGALVLTGGGTDRAAEEETALHRLCAGADLTLQVVDLPDGRLPAHFAEVKDAFLALRALGVPDLVLGPQRGDAHQDHRLVAQIVPTIFRTQPALGYEILKWEGDLPTATIYQPLTPEQVDHKLAVLQDCYPSQVDHDWYDDEAFRGLARLRGVQCHTRYAEAFVAEKLVVQLGSDPYTTPMN